ncbi:hypothetical protein DIPPA_12547 [Diplonema papillatum]|nr:hypothetical protein DIPPA_12547 [Diplonema papillatum]
MAPTKVKHEDGEEEEKYGRAKQKVRLLGTGEDDRRAIWGLKEAWAVLDEGDWSGVKVDDFAQSVQLKQEPSGLRETATAAGVAACCAAALSEACGKGALSLHPVKPAEEGSRAAVAPRVRALQKAAVALERAAQAISKARVNSDATVSSILAQQHEGNLLERRMFADSSATHLSDLLSSAPSAREQSFCQAAALLWNSLNRTVPNMGLPIFSITPSSLSVGLVPWTPRYCVLSAEAEPGTSVRSGHQVHLTCGQLPKQWVTGHLVGCVADAIQANEPHKPLTTVDSYVERGIQFLRLIALLLFIADQARAVGFSAAAGVLQYPSVGTVTLADPVTLRVCCIVKLVDFTARIEDPATPVPHVEMGAASVTHAYLKSLRARYRST